MIKQVIHIIKIKIHIIQMKWQLYKIVTKVK